MCLINATKRKAKDDILCYKVLSPRLAYDKRGFRICITSPYRTEYEWKAGLNEAEGPAEVKRSVVSAGFLHTYANYIDAKNFANFIRARVYKAIIPKGSVYYCGNAENAMEIQYASKKLILMQQIY